MFKEDQKTKKQVIKKNQQRCLNYQHFNRSKAYLSRQNCKKNIIYRNYPCFDEFKEKFEHNNFQTQNSDFDQFNHDRVKSQIKKIHQVINNIQYTKKQQKIKFYNAKSLELQKDHNSIQNSKLNKKNNNFIKQDGYGMVRIKSSKNVIKVYNPFPTPFAEMIQTQQ